MSHTHDGLVLVTGATGFVAGHVIRELLEHGYDVRGTVRNPAAVDKTAHLTAVAERTGGHLELIRADLGDDEGWSAAVAGCRYVLHVASPFPDAPPEHEDELIRPAVDGTRRVLHACAASGSVERVVQTSSVAAVVYGAGHQSGPHTEHDWTDVNSAQPYAKSKTLAERAAWEFVDQLPEEQRFELVVVNPGMVLGPLMNAQAGTSVELVRRLMSREMPMVPQMGFAPVDVRDVATAHRLAMERADAAGNRYICAGEPVWATEMAGILAAEFNPQGYRVPTAKAPYWLMWLIGRFDRTIRLALGFIGRTEVVSAAKARRDLGWTIRPIEASLVDTAQSLIEHGIVERRATGEVAAAHDVTPDARKAGSGG